MARRLTVLTGGHPFEEEPFAALLASLGDWNVTHLRHPEAEQAVADGALDAADTVLFYDMPGYDFTSGAAVSRPPCEGFKEKLRARFSAGKGAVAMHHAIAGWAAWDQWGEWLGGRFLYRPGKVRGAAKPDSGYRHDVDYQAHVLADHPVTAGIPGEFHVCDELYLAEVFTLNVEPLLRSGYRFIQDHFYSAEQAVAGAMFSNAGWEHAPGSDLIGWVSRAINAPLVYLQFGDGPAAYTNPHLRRILANALEFAATNNGDQAWIP